MYIYLPVPISFTGRCSHYRRRGGAGGATFGFYFGRAAPGERYAHRIEQMMISLPLRNTEYPLPTTAAGPQRLTPTRRHHCCKKRRVGPVDGLPLPMWPIIGPPKLAPLGDRANPLPPGGSYNINNNHFYFYFFFCCCYCYHCYCCCCCCCRHRCCCCCCCYCFFCYYYDLLLD